MTSRQPGNLSALGWSVVLVTSVIFFYGVVIRQSMARVRSLTQVALVICPAARQYTVGEVEAIVRLVVGGLLQLLFCATILRFSGVGLRQLQPHTAQPLLLPYAAALGVGEMGLATFLGYVGMQAGLVFASTRVPKDIDRWLLLARSGWMSQFFRAFEIAPAVALTLSVVYISVEEIVFRGVIITTLGESGPAWALGISLLAFVGAQVFQMPSWQSAMFPVVGALVIGLVHGLLFLSVPSMLPLIVAHLVFFLVVIL